MAAGPYPPVIKPEDFLDPIDNPNTGDPPGAPVCRTASDSNPLSFNTLVPPEHGVVWIQLSAGTVFSKSYGGTEAKDGDDSFHYAPTVEDCTLKFKMNNKKGGISGAQLQIFRRFDPSPLWERPLTEDEITDGEHSVAFTLGTQANPKFPDLVPTVEHSPYKVRILVNASVRPQSPLAWTYFHVLIKDITLELGEKKVLPPDPAPVGGVKKGGSRDLYDTFSGKLAEEGKTLKCTLLSNLFKTTVAKMFDRSSFTDYQTQWGDGPQIPIFAKLRIRKTDDTAVDAPKALGKVKCLWDYEDMPDDSSSMAAPPATFVIRSENYNRGLTLPKGDNCHEDRGGKRAAAGSTHPVFPHQAGYDPLDTAKDNVFPFFVEAGGPRDWAGLSEPWRSGVYAGKTGVMFQPCRMAGDAYKITCYVAWEKDKKQNLVLNTTDDIADKTDLKAGTGTYQIWRRHHLNRYIKKKNFAMAIPIAAVQAYYEKAYIDMFQSFAAVETMTEATYNSQMATIRGTLGDLGKAAIDPAVNQYTAGDSCVTFRTYNNFKVALQIAMHWSNADLANWLATTAGTPYSTAANYETRCDRWGDVFLSNILNSLLPGTDGVTLVQFIGVHNIGGQGGLNGAAFDVTGATPQRCVFVTCALPNAYSSGANKLEQTTTHEIGHHLYMPHAPTSVTATDAANRPDPTEHDKDDTNCTMSYNFTAERRWCGYCILRLRGWDKQTLSNDGTLNVKP